MLNRELTLIGPLPPPRSGTTIKNQILRDALREAGISVHCINTQRSRISLIFPLIHLAFSSKRKNILISVSKNGRYVLIPYAYIAKKIFKKNVVLMPCGGRMPDEIAGLNSPLRRFYTNACSSLEKIFVETDSMRRALSKVVQHANIEVMFNFKPRPSQIPERAAHTPPPFRLVFLGRIREEKGVFYLIDAIKIVREVFGKAVILDFYGDFLPNEKEVENRFQELVAGSSCLFYKGYLMANHINQVLKEYDALIFPTHYQGEGFPGVLIDAAYAGLPVVATRFAYNSEIVIHGETGLLCNAKDASSLAEKINYLCEAPQECRQLGLSNWQRSTRYDPGRAALQIADVFFKA